MDFLPEIGFNKADEEQRMALQKTAVEYCNKRNDLETAGSSLSADVKTDDSFEAQGKKRSPKYYTSGSIPVAVINSFAEPTDTINSFNTIKSINPDISLLEFNGATEKKHNSIERGVNNFIKKHPALDVFIYDNTFLNTVSRTLLPNSEEDITEECLDNIADLNKNGIIPFKAVNMPISQNCSFRELNRLVIQELNTEITPENLSKYKKHIKEILKSKRTQRLISQNKKIKISQLLNIIRKMENLEVPVYIPASNSDKSFNILSLANNAISVQEADSEPYSLSRKLAEDMKKYTINNVYKS